MSIASNLQRIINAKSAIKAAIIDKGVEVPDTEKLDAYYSYIDQIGGESNNFFEPDLSQPLDQAQLDNLQNIVSAGKASEYLNLGDELLVNYGKYVMPFEVVGFEDVEVEGGATKPAINLLAKYTDETGSARTSGEGLAYADMQLQTYITTTYQNKLDANFVACLAQTKTQMYKRDGSVDVAYSKLFAPSMENLGVTDTACNTVQQAAVEGPAFTAYQSSTNDTRKKHSINANLPTDAFYAYWTRSLCPSKSNNYGAISVAGVPVGNGLFTTLRVVVACNFIGKD